MRFELGEEAVALRDVAADVLASEVTPAVVRAGWPGGDAGLVAAAWRALARVGATGTLVPAERGGLGLDENCLVPLLEEIGHSGLPGPAAETIAVAAPLLSGDALAGLLTGDTLVTAAFAEGDLVSFGQQARLVMLPEGRALRVYEPGELDLEPCPAIDGSRAVARLRRRPAAGGELLTDDPQQVRAAWQRGVLGTSALLTGLARRMLDLTVGYVQQREQFGVPVGSFQAIKHALASTLLAVEFARPVVLAAGWALAASEPGAGDQVSAAKVVAGDAARLTARTAIQCHGAIGYTTEYDLHLYAKRVWALTPAWGDPAHHRARIAHSLNLQGAANG